MKIDTRKSNRFMMKHLVPLVLYLLVIGTLIKDQHAFVALFQIVIASALSWNIGYEYLYKRNSIGKTWLVVGFILPLLVGFIAALVNQLTS